MSTPSFTLAAPIPRSPSLHATHTGEFELLRILAGAQRGLIVVAQMARPEDCVAALKIARALGWPMVADVLSGAASALNMCSTLLQAINLADCCLLEGPTFILCSRVIARQRADQRVAWNGGGLERLYCCQRE